MRIRISIATTIVCASLLVAGPAQATNACSFTPKGSGVVTVAPRSGTSIRLFVDLGGQIMVAIDGTVEDCGEATISNTGIVDMNGTDQANLLGISQNGAGGEFPSTIFFLVDGVGGSNEFRLTGGPDSDRFRFGVDPADSGTAPAADLFESGNSRIRLFNIQFASARMLGGNDSVTGRPGEGFEGALTIPLDATGGRGNDEVTGGKVSDDLGGGAGADILKGLAGGDSLSGGAGGDDLSGGPGTDDCSGGPGNDLIRGCEN